MSTFYGVVKTLLDSMKFILITGVTKFSQMDDFSSLNTLVDISRDGDYGAMSGFTPEDLDTYFSRHIDFLSGKLGLARQDLLDRIRDKYDGFSFDGKTKIYNPYSIVNFLRNGEFKNYWMESGSVSIIREFMKNRVISPETYEGIRVTKSEIDSPVEIEKVSTPVFLYQTGYLTLSSKDSDSYYLDYPNAEVHEAFSYYFLSNFYSSEDDSRQAFIDLQDSLKAVDVPKIVMCFRDMYRHICYEDINQVKQAEARAKSKLSKGIPDEEHGKVPPEGYYRSLLFSYLYGAGVDVTAEPHRLHGRPDIEFKYHGTTYVIEMKVNRDSKPVIDAAKAGMEQIFNRFYADGIKRPVIISLAIDSESRNIGACSYIQGGTGYEIEYTLLGAGGTAPATDPPGGPAV
jgi:hypothetical protein